VDGKELTMTGNVASVQTKETETVSDDSGASGSAVRRPAEVGRALGVSVT
jgi:hypothetical protein